MNKFMKLSVLSAAMAAVAGLSGCSSTGGMQLTTSLSPEFMAKVVTEATTYDKSHSFAWNITKVMNIEENFKDAYLDEKEYNEAEQSSKLGWYTGATLLTGNPFDLGAMIYLFAPTVTNIAENPVYLGYYPKDKAQDERTAFRAFEQQVLDAYEAAATEMGFKNTGYKLALNFERPKTDGSITVKMKLRGGRLAKLAYDTNIPEWISAGKETVWAVGASPTAQLGMDTLRVLDGGFFNFSADYKLQGELMERVAKHLPNHAFMFVPSMRNENGDRTPAYVTDNKQKYFFVMPKSAQAK